MRKQSAREIAVSDWYFTAAPGGGYTNEQIRTAATLQVAHELRAINNKLDALGHDGIHDLIRVALKSIRRKDRAAKARAKRAAR